MGLEVRGRFRTDWRYRESHEAFLARMDASLRLVRETLFRATPAVKKRKAPGNVKVGK